MTRYGGTKVHVGRAEGARGLVPRRARRVLAVLAVGSILAACGPAAEVSPGNASGGIGTGGAKANGAGGDQTAGGTANAQAGGMGGDTAVTSGGSLASGPNYMLSPTGDCSMVVSGEDYCRADAAFDAKCGKGDEASIFRICMAQNVPSFDTMDPCLAGVIMRSCFEYCEWTTCSAEAIGQTHPELVREDILTPCLRDPYHPPPGVDCSQGWLEGRQVACLDKSRECNAPQDHCISANVVREELLPQTEACIAGTCENLDSCLKGVLGVE
jgi:hypothetical protein